MSKDLVLWYLDSGYSLDMMGDQSIFTCLESHNRGSVTFSDNGKGKVIGKGIARKSLSIKNGCLVEGWKLNRLKNSQFCDVNKRATFEPYMCKLLMVILMKYCFMVIGKIIFTSSIPVI